MRLSGKKIILGISGSIAAYKAALLTRLFIKAGAEVQVVMTPRATDFVSALTLSTLSRRPVFSSVHTGEGWNNHVELGLWADYLVIAPATANTLARMANGICDNMLLAVYLSARCPVFFAPAMDLDMWEHFSTRKNLDTLIEGGNHLIPVGHGELASGLVGAGRMAEPETIIQLLADHSERQQDLKDKKIMVTAGPTYEAIDPVRFIGNRSSGKMGIAIAEELAQRGATVHLILGPTTLRPVHPGVQTIPVTSAAEMYKAAEQYFKKADAAILAAAVADYRPKKAAKEKMKKKAGDLSILLERTTDIAATLGAKKRKKQVIVGFALETNNEKSNAAAKLHKKNFDFIVLNSLRDAGAGFQHDTNKITIIRADQPPIPYELKSKTAVATDIVNELVKTINR